ncbi:Nuclease-related domain-containing protein [Gracilibacillus orientalis]|uniref:Nuclease-related domain-containing protein n=1 Tax=Gracilibacillus orientalis TaxID=334253 RepID=A0A1I4HTF8_9BACI|nr:nuclease-related domain-containing protein [Gracilibacillus orientalis]SFL44901.1 Nuclease-related domain-containing protein [Gracilibacillus orientalis]
MWRDKPYELQLYDALNRRKLLSKEERKKYNKLQVGYQGELLLDDYVGKIPDECIMLQDLSLSFKNRYFQIDSILIINNQLHLFEVKNYQGEYYYEKDKLYLEQGVEVDDPLTQLKRSESLLRQLVSGLGFHISIQARVVFVNSEFTLYLESRHPKILLSTQLNRYFRQFQKNTPIDPIFHSLAIGVEQSLLKSEFNTH